MKIKRLLSLILCVAMIFTVTQTTTSYAEDTVTPKVYVDSVSAMQGSSVTVYVGIQNAVNIGGLDVSVFYDPDAMTVSSANRESFVDGASVSINTGTAGTVKESIVAMDGLNGDGYLMSINFSISEDAAVKDYALTVGIGEAFDTSFKDISVDRSSGKITVTKNESIVREAYFYSSFDPSGSVSEGDEVHYKVFADNANGLAGGTFDFTYDPEILEFKDAAIGEELKSETAIYSVNSRSPGLVRITYAEIEAITQNYGVEFFDVSFAVKKDIAASTTVSFSGSSLLDANLNSMITSGTSSSISVVKKAAKLYIDWDGTEDGERKFTADVILTGDSNVGAGDFWIEYDTSMLSCESVVTDPSVADSGAYLVTKEDTSGGRISFSYVNSKGCSTDSTLLHITFKQLHGVTGDTGFTPGGRDVVDKDLNDITINYPSKTITMPYDAHDAETIPGIAPTCTHEGLTDGIRCSECGEELAKQEVIPALGHDLIHHDAKAPACEEIGWDAYDTCSRCDYTTYVELPATGHTPVTDPAVAPTCEGTGLTEGSHCSVCGKVLVKQETVPATGHSWREPIYTWSADNSQVTAERVCANDALHVEKETVGTSYSEITPATETAAGVGRYTSEAFSNAAFTVQTKDIELPPTGYEVSYEWSSDNTKVTGKAVPYDASLETVTETVSATFEATKEPTCTEKGAGIWTSASFTNSQFAVQTKEAEVPALGHDWGEWVVIKEASTTEEGLERRECLRDIDHYETRAIPKKVPEKTGWIYENGYWYFYDNNGVMVTSAWMKDSKGWCWLQEDGRMLTNGWAKDRKGTCWIGSNGYMPTTTQWIKYDGSWYHITEGYRDESKWMKDSQGWCWLQADGRMLTNGWAKDSIGWCWIASNGYMPTTTQWIKYDGSWYHITKGYRDQSKWMKDSQGWCWLQADGRMLTNGWAKDSIGWCWIAANGYMPTTTQWIKYDGGWYYIEKGYRVQNAWRKDSKGWCYLGPEGRMVTNDFVKDSKGYCWIGPDGYMEEVDKWIGEAGAVGSSYIIAGYRVDGKTITIDGVQYTFDKDGKLVNGN